MSFATALNEILHREHPAAARCLTPMGQRLYFPKGITAQAADASRCEVNATIGQLTDGHGRALPLPAMSRHIVGLTDEEVFLYASQGGRKDLRAAWQARLRHLSNGSISLPIVTNGLTHGLGVVAELFCDAETRVLLPSPGWGNYTNIFGIRGGAPIDPYTTLLPDPWRLAVDALAAKLQAAAGQRTVLVLNFPSNPTGYTPTRQEGAALLEALRAAPGPLVVVCDDAYQGMFWEDNLMEEGLFARLCEVSDPERLLPIRIDGATKELFFFGGRLGFITFGAPPEAAKVLEEKTRALLRFSVSSMAAPSQAMVMSALRERDLAKQQEAIRSVLRRRYRTFKDAFEAADLSCWPFNSAFYALVKVGADAEAVRQRLLKQGIGVIAIPKHHAVRVSYSTVPEEALPRVAAALAVAIREEGG